MAKQTTVNLGMGTRGTPVLVFQLFYAFGLIFLINHVGCALAVPRVHTCAELVNPLGEVHLRGSSVRGGGGWSLMQPCASQRWGTRNAPRDPHALFAAEKVQKTCQPSVCNPHPPASPASTISTHLCRRGPKDARHPRSNHALSQGHGEELTQRPQKNLRCQEGLSIRNGEAMSPSLLSLALFSVCSSAKPPCCL